VRLIFFSLLIFVLTACASNAPAPLRYALSEKEKLPPINLSVSAGQYATESQAKTVEHIAQSVERSGLFSAVETRFARHPLLLLISYKCDIPNDAGNFANSMLSAATLFIVPSSLKKIHTINVEIFLGNKSILKKDYTEEHKVTMSIYTMPHEQHLDGVNKVLNKFFEDLRENKIIPRIADFPSSVEKMEEKI
jgi:hypothetical protein